MDVDLEVWMDAASFTAGDDPLKHPRLEVVCASIYRAPPRRVALLAGAPV